MRDGLLIDSLRGLRRVGHGSKHVAPCSMRIDLCECGWNRCGFCVCPRAVHEVGGGEPAPRCQEPPGVVRTGSEEIAIGVGNGEQSVGHLREVRLPIDTHQAHG